MIYNIDIYNTPKYDNRASRAADPLYKMVVGNTTVYSTGLYTTAAQPIVDFSNPIYILKNA